MDPFELKEVQGVSQLIFQHFNAQELINLSEVSKEWFESTSSLKTFGKVQLKLDFPCYELTSEDFEALSKTKRKYKTIVVDSHTIPEATSLSVLRNFSETVEDLSIGFKSPKHPCDHDSTPVHYPNLKKLEILSAAVEVEAWLRGTVVDQLEELIFKDQPWGKNDWWKEDVNFSNMLEVILKQTKLKRLDIGDHPLLLDLYEDVRKEISPPPFKLESLRMSYRAFGNMSSFLVLQRETLTSLDIAHVDNRELVTSLIQDFPNLTELRVQYCIYSAITKDLFTTDDMEIGKNLKIEYLEISFAENTINSIRTVQALLNAIPMLKTFHMKAKLTNTLMEWIAKKMKNLEKIYYEYGDDQIERFSEIKFLVPNTNRKIQLVKNYGK